MAELAEYHNGRAFKPTEWSRAGLPIVRIAQITDPSTTPNYYAGTDLDPRHRVEDGDLLFSWSATLSVIRWNRGPAAVNQHIFKVVERAGIDKAFLQHLLSNCISALAEESHGSTMKHIRKGVLDTFTVPVPPLPEQRKIAAILSSVDETIEKTEAVIAQLDVVKKAMLEERLTRGIPGRHSRFKQTEIGEVPEEWDIRPLGELVDFINGRAFSERDWKKTGVPIIRIQNLNGGSEFNYFQGEVEDRFAVRPNDLLFSWSGTRGTSFGPHVWRGPAGVLNQHIFNVKNLRGVTRGYTLWALRFITGRIEKAAHGGSGIVHITKGALERFLVPVPDAAEQAAIAERLQAIDGARRATAEDLIARSGLKSSLAEALLSGTVRTVEGAA